MVAPAPLLIVPLRARPVTVPLLVRVMGRAGARKLVSHSSVVSRIESLSLRAESRERVRRGEEAGIVQKQIYAFENDLRMRIRLSKRFSKT